MQYQKHLQTIYKHQKQAWCLFGVYNVQKRLVFGYFLTCIRYDQSVKHGKNIIDGVSKKKENKRVFLRYVNEGDKKEQLDLKVLQVERIAERMITRDPLEKIFDGPIPEEFAGKHITIYATLPHARKSFLNHDKTETITTNTIEFIYKLEENTEE